MIPLPKPLPEADITVDTWVVPDIHPSPPLQGTNINAGKSVVELEDEAREAGFQQGRQEGLEAGMSEVRHLTTQLAGLIDAMTVPFANLDLQVARQLSQLALRIAQQIVHREVEVDEEIINRVVKEALQVLGNVEEDVEIHLNTQDYHQVQDFLSADQRSSRWQLVSDASLARGGCVVRTAFSTIDASIENQLQHILDQLMESSEEVDMKTVIPPEIEDGPQESTDA